MSRRRPFDFSFFGTSSGPSGNADAVGSAGSSSTLWRRRSGGFEPSTRRPFMLPLTMWLGRSSTVAARTSSMPFSSTPVAVRSAWVTIIGLMTKGATPMTPGTFLTVSITFRYS